MMKRHRSSPSFCLPWESPYPRRGQADSKSALESPSALELELVRRILLPTTTATRTTATHTTATRTTIHVRFTWPRSRSM